MSERPKAAGPVMSRLRRPAGRLRDLPIWSKLGLIMIVPTLATIVVGTSGLVDHIRTATNAARAQTLADLSQVSGALVDNLQNERAHAVISLSVPSVDKAGRDRALQSYTGVHPAVDNAKRPYSQQRTSLNDVPPNLRKLLDDIDQSLGELPSLRSMVVNGKLQLSQAAGSYASLLSDLIDIRDSAAQLAGDPTLSDEMRAAGAVARSKEYLSMQRIVVHQALSVKAINAQLRKEYIATQTGQQQALQTFKSVANPTAGDLYNQTVTGPDLREAVSFAGYLEGMSGESLVGAPFDAASWDAAMVSQSRLVRNVETRLDADIVNRATRLKDDVQTRVLVETGVLLGMLLLAILFAWLVARSMARSLRELRHGALAVAQYGLPQAVARLRDPALSAHLSSAQLATQIAEPLPVRSRDEFGQVTEAFNAVHLEAVRTAAEQAALRASVSTMFVNLARRSQILVDRLIGHLDRLERGEEDPDRLAELFQLDHLATRMRRNDENLLVLAGADSTRIQREPAALMDVLRAAQSEVEHYTRIEFGMIDRDIEVSAHAVNDLVHLVAELFDNATAFSPPDSHVMVEARRVGDRAVLYVEDRGIGISGEQLRDLNDRLATPPMVDVTVSRMMGLVVVARLANRHGVKVELRPAAERGTVAEVNLPTAVLVPRALTGRLQQGAATAFDAGPVPQPAPRPTFAAPLALESGPAAAPSVPREPAPAYPTGRPFDPNPPLNGGGLIGAGPSRTMPAWSDLTGAAGTNGTNGRDALPFRPVPNGHGGDPLPQRPPAGDPWTVDGEVAGPGSATTIPRQMPSHPESYLRGPGVPPVSAPPVVSSPPVSGIPASGIPASGAPMSRGSAFGGPVSGGPVSGAPVSGGPVSGASPVTLPPTISPPPGFRAGQPGVPPVNPVSAPPAWPPVTAERDATAGAPPVPESLAAALDLTAELPRVRSEAARSGAVPTSTPQGPTHQGPTQQTPTQQTPTLQSPGQQGPGQQGPGQQGPGQQSPGQQAPVRRPTVAPAPMHQPAAQRPTGPQPAMQQPATPPSPARPPAPQPVVSSERRTRYADETMELPIFRELESAWFRTGRSGAKESASRPAAAPETTTPGRTAPGPTAAGQPASGRPAADQAAPDQRAADQVAPDQAAREQGAPDPAADGSRTTVKSSDDAVAAAAGSTQARPSGTAGNDAPTAPPASGPADGGTPRGPQLVPGRNGAAAGNGAGATVPGRPEGPGWQTAADDGWRAAVAAADVPVVHTTQAGLPKRTPMAQLVPGGVDKAGTSVQRRTPESVRGLLSAYHRGVQRGRTKDHSTSPEDSPGGQQSSQSGLGPTAGSGQKEQEG